MKTRIRSHVTPRGAVHPVLAIPSAASPRSCASPSKPFSLSGRLAAGGGVLVLAVLLAGGLTTRAVAQTTAPGNVTITVSPNLPADIAGGAPNATLSQAAAFAWQEFIALNWPAVAQSGAQGTRETADTTKFFGDPTYNSAAKPLVWHTYRGKVEIFPGSGVPNGSTAMTAGQPQLKNLGSAAQPYYGYDGAPVYTYSSTAIAPYSGTQSTTTPWINLDENSQIGLDLIYAGAGAQAGGPSGNQILFAAKGSRAEFDYLAPLGWWSSGAPFAATKQYIQQNLASPPAGSTTLVSFPLGTVELKTAWRKLAPNEDASRFYTTTVRYYVNNGGTKQYVDDTFALLALHIIQKTPTAPYFIFATFEQADNITDVRGGSVEDADGAPIGQPAATAFTPEIVSHNATAQSYQTFSPTQSSVQNPLGQLFYQNEPGNGLTDGTILVNRRKHAIPSDIIAVNRAAHAAIASYVTANLPAGTSTPWGHYKLVNVQAVPLSGKTPGVDYTGPLAATYYQANSVVETDYDLQVFSGKFYGGPFIKTVSNTITDFTVAGKPFANVAHAGTGYNMGGCMGCHGNAQQGGGDFSFILLGGPVTSGPDAVHAAASVVGAAISPVGAPAPAPGPRHVQQYKLRP